MATDPAEVLRSRIRRYFLVVLALVGAAAVFVIALAKIVEAAGVESKTADAVVGIGGFLAMLGVVVSSWIAVAKYWRCPACEKNVYWTVSWNMSVFAGGASPNCPNCGVELFNAAGRKRAFRIIVIAICLGLAAGLLGVMLSSRRAERTVKPSVEASRQF